jgi:hypothetical protein
MKIIASLIALFVSVSAISQDLKTIQNKIDSLQDLKTMYESKIQQLDKAIKDLENAKVITSYEKYDDLKYIVPNQPLVRIRDKDDTSGKILAEPQNGEVITLIDFNDKIDYWLVSYKNLTGYVNDVLIQQSAAIQDFKKYLTAKTLEKVRADELIAVENDRKASEARNVLLKQQEEKRKIEQQKRDDEAIKLVVEAKQKEQERKAAIIKKYGNEIGQKIISQKIWIGMTSKMAQESWGSPNDINRTVGSWGVHEQWVYSHDTYLYFENGILTSWQD